jgi:hypothetical protein
MLLVSQAFAATNLPLSCKAALTGTACAEANYQYVPGKAGLVVATPSSGWRLWEVIAATDDIRACPADITAGTLCAVNRATIKKSAAAVEPVTVPPMTIRVTWIAPTTGLQDEKPVTLQPGDILGYEIAWVPKAGGRGGEFAVPAGQTTYTFTIPAQSVSVSMSVQGKDSWGPSSENVPADPLAPKPVVPGAVTGFKVDVVP